MMPSHDPLDIFFGVDAPQDTQDSQDTQRLTENLKRTSIDLHLPGFAEIAATPLEEYVRQSLEFDRQLSEEHKRSTSPVFHFARFCKAHPAITDLPDYAAVQEVENVMFNWDDLPEDGDPWEHFFPEADDCEAARIDFMTSWNAIRHVPFQDILQNALRLSEEIPLRPAHPRGSLYQRFVSLAGWLQVLANGRVIYLPTRKLNSLLGCDHTMVSRLRKLAIQDGLLTVAKQHSFRPNGKGEATEFRFAVERFEVLRGEP
jgi:hypothetical protein